MTGYGEEAKLPEQADPDFHQFMEYWKSLTAGGKAIPSRKQFDLLALPSLTPRYAMIEWFDGIRGPRLRYRFFGSSHQEHIGRDLTGRLIDDVWDTRKSELAHELYGNLSKSGKPHFWQRTVEFAGSPTMGFDRLICPLEEVDGRPRMFIGLWKFYVASAVESDVAPHALTIRKAD